MAIEKRNRIKDLQKDAPKISVIPPEEHNLDLLFDEESELVDDIELDIREPRPKIKRRVGRPEKLDDEKIPSKLFTVRLSGDHLEALEESEGKTGTEKIKNLIEEYVDLKNAINHQLNHLRAQVYSGQKVFFSLGMSRELFRYKIQYPHTLTCDIEKERIVEMLGLVKKLTNSLKRYGLSDDLIRSQMKESDFEFLIWMRKPL